jgi:hypothetical protein
MTAFLESPWPALGLAALALGLLGVAWHNTRHPRLIHGMFGVLALMLVLLLVQWLVVTDREAIANRLEGMAVALESNDLERVMAFLAPDGDRIRADARHYLPGVEVSDANVGGDLIVTVNRLTSPPSARATFTGRITAANRNPAERMPHDNFVKKFTLKLRQEPGGSWLVTDYEMGDLRQ